MGRHRTRARLEELPQVRPASMFDDRGWIAGPMENDTDLRVQHFLYGGWVTLTPAVQPFGGIRMWYRCDCGRRCGVLYLERGEWRCRLCVGHPYASQCSSVPDRLRQRAFKLYDRVNVNYRCAPRARGPKPKWMRWGTYWRLYEEAHSLDTQALLRSVSACRAMQLAAG